MPTHLVDNNMIDGRAVDRMGIVVSDLKIAQKFDNSTRHWMTS
jgi:hypothetical protein